MTRNENALLFPVGCLLAGAITLSAPLALAQTGAPATSQLRTVPVPDTVSPQMQKLIAAPPAPTWNVIPDTPDGWRAQVPARPPPRRRCRRCANSFM
jgi:hypothetical protein